MQLNQNHKCEHLKDACTPPNNHMPPSVPSLNSHWETYKKVSEVPDSTPAELKKARESLIVMLHILGKHKANGLATLPNPTQTEEGITELEMEVSAPAGGGDAQSWAVEAEEKEKRKKEEEKRKKEEQKERKRRRKERQRNRR